MCFSKFSAKIISETKIKHALVSVCPQGTRALLLTHSYVLLTKSSFTKSLKNAFSSFLTLDDFLPLDYVFGDLQKFVWLKSVF